MKCNLFSILLLCLCGQFYVNCGLLDGFISGDSGSSGQVSNRGALILAVENDGHIYLAKNQFVTAHMNKLYSKFLFLCPAETPEDLEINKSSKTENVFFIKKIHENKVNARNNYIVNHTCQNPVKPSLIDIGSYPSNSAINMYLVGYEVYLSEFAKGFHMDDYFGAKLANENSVWFNIYTIAFNSIKRSVVHVFSQSLAYKNNKMQLPKELPLDDSLGMKEFYDGIDITQIYAKDHIQEVYNELYKDVYMPFSYVDQIQDRYLIPIHLAHLDSFGIPLLKQAGNIYVNGAPMWNIVYDNAWLKIEKNLDTLTQGVNAVNIITGVYGTLAFSGVQFYLGPDNTVEVPEAFYKIISYSPNNEKKYNMVIVTNNNPYVETDTNEKICKQNQCKNFGWDHFQQDSDHLGRTTCCKLTIEVLTELKLRDFSNLVDKTLDLNNVPHWKNNGLTLNIRDYISNQIHGVVNNDKDLIIDREEEEVTFRNFINTLYRNYVSSKFTFTAKPRD